MAALLKRRPRDRGGGESGHRRALPHGGGDVAVCDHEADYESLDLVGRAGQKAAGSGAAAAATLPTSSLRAKPVDARRGSTAGTALTRRGIRSREGCSRPRTSSPSLASSSDAASPSAWTSIVGTPRSPTLGIDRSAPPPRPSRRKYSGKDSEGGLR